RTPQEERSSVSSSSGCACTMTPNGSSDKLWNGSRMCWQKVRPSTRERAPDATPRPTPRLRSQRDNPMNDEDDKLQLVSHFPGRLRVRARRFHEQPEIAEAAAGRLRKERGVVSATASALTGSILIVYDHRTVQIDTLIAVLLSVSGHSSVAADAEAHPDGMT